MHCHVYSIEMDQDVVVMSYHVNTLPHTGVTSMVSDASSLGDTLRPATHQLVTFKQPVLVQQLGIHQVLVSVSDQHHHFRW